MKHDLWSILAKSGSLSLQDMILHMGAAAILGIVICFSFWYTHGGRASTQKGAPSLMTLTILAAAVIGVIENNVALALGMMGVLSVLRCRIPVKNSGDMIYIFWAIIVGVCCGTGEYLVAGAGTVVVFVVLLVVGRGQNEERIGLVVRGARSKCLEIEGLIFDFFGGKAVLQTKNTTAETVELVFEMPRSAYRVTYQRSHDITDKLYALGGVEYVNIVTQSDEITE